MHDALSPKAPLELERDAQMEIASWQVLAQAEMRRFTPYLHETAKIASAYGTEAADYRWRAARAILRFAKDTMTAQDFADMDVDTAVARLKARTPPLRPQQRAAAEMFLRNVHGDAYARFLEETDALPATLRMRLRTEALCLGSELRLLGAHRRNPAPPRHVPRTPPASGGTLAPLRRIL